MKKTFLIFGMAALLGTTGCGNADKTQSANEAVTDSLTTADASSEAPAVVEIVNPEDVLELEVVKKDLSYIPESSIKRGSWTVKVTNTGSTPVSGNAYNVIWTENIEFWDEKEDCFDYKDIERCLEGQDIAPGENVTFELKSSDDGCQSFKNPKIRSVE